jgi:hypothetical protein
MAMRNAALTGQLYFNGQHVGDIAVRGWHGSWGFGDFNARPAFDQFASLFAEWSRLMHANPGRLSRENALRLREVENRTYALRARLWLVEARQWRHIAILNIDGAMIEWKEAWTGGVADTGTALARRIPVRPPGGAKP